MTNTSTHLYHVVSSSYSKPLNPSSSYGTYMHIHHSWPSIHRIHTGSGRIIHHMPWIHELHVPTSSNGPCLQDATSSDRQVRDHHWLDSPIYLYLPVSPPPPLSPAADPIPLYPILWFVGSRSTSNPCTIMSQRARSGPPYNPYTRYTGNGRNGYEVCIPIYYLLHLLPYLTIPHAYPYIPWS